VSRVPQVRVMIATPLEQELAQRVEPGVWY
jgi:hypothetical protein